MKETSIKFKSYDGYGLEGTMLKADKERAALLFVHGITSSRNELGFHSDYAIFLANHGISSLRFDYRYHGIHQTKLDKLTLGGIVNDIDSAFHAIKTKAEKGTKSFFVVGTSFGGGLSAFWANFYNKSEVKRIFLNAPVIDYEDDVLARNKFISDGLLSSKGQKQLNTKEHIVSSGISFGRSLINEVKYINGIKPIRDLAEKVVIFHGDQDEDVPLASSKKFKSSKTVLKIIPNVGHGFGVEDDEDLDFPETKEIHKKIYAETLKIINRNI